MKNIEEVAGKQKKQTLHIYPPNFGLALFHVRGVSPLVIHRFSAKVKEELAQKQWIGKASSSRKRREPQDKQQLFQDAKYIGREGWEGLHAGSIRNACISACKLVGFKMTLAKLSIFVIADGYDKAEPQIPLVRIYGKSLLQEDLGRVETGQPYVIVRPAYHDWKLRIRIKWDADQFTLADVTNLLSRVGQQVGLGEGRYDSRNSAGMGWGLFDLEGAE